MKVGCTCLLQGDYVQPTFIKMMTIEMRGNNPSTSIKTTHFASYLDEIYTYLLQTFDSRYVFIWSRHEAKWGGNNPTTSIKTTHFDLHRLDESVWYISPSRMICITHFHLTRRIKMRSDNPSTSIKTTHFASYLWWNLYSVSCQTFDSTHVFIWSRDESKWGVTNLVLALKPTHFASYLDEIYMWISLKRFDRTHCIDLIKIMKQNEGFSP